MIIITILLFFLFVNTSNTLNYLSVEKRYVLFGIASFAIAMAMTPIFFGKKNYQDDLSVIRGIITSCCLFGSFQVETNTVLSLYSNMFMMFIIYYNCKYNSSSGTKKKTKITDILPHLLAMWYVYSMWYSELYINIFGFISIYHYQLSFVANLVFTYMKMK